jgi:CubicO group peptidase (beta-lactamase class C family)
MKRIHLLRLLVAVIFVLAQSGVALSAEDLPRAEPETVGLSAERLKRIDGWMQRYVADGRLAGMEVAIMRRGKLAYWGRTGLADIAKATPLGDDTLYRIFSMTKPITGVALMILFEEGKFLLDDPVAKYLPEFDEVKVFAGTDDKGNLKLETPRRPMTIRHLMTHMAGLAYGVLRDTPVDRLYMKEKVFDYSDTLAQFTAKLGKQPLLHHPGEIWDYSVAVDVQARLVEVLSGQSFDSYLQARLFAPLGMVDTAFILSGHDQGRLATAYQRDSHGNLRVAVMPPERTMTYDAKVRLMSGGAGLVSSMHDYLCFADMLANDGIFRGQRILAPKTVDLMMLDHVPPDTGPFPERFKGYGFGLNGAVRRDVAVSQLPGSEGEYTWGGAASTVFWVDRKERLAVVLMTQFVPSDAYFLHQELRALVYQALMD